jgi:hypothetical protein
MSLKPPINITRRWKIISVFLLSMAFIVVFIKKTIMAQNNTRAIVLYGMDYSESDRAFRKELDSGEEHYKDWFLRNAKEIPISNDVYQEVFLRSPIISTGITNTLLEETYHLFKDTGHSNLIYFVLNPDPYLRLLKQEMNVRFKTAEIESFSKVLEDVANDRTFVVVEYHKNLGWFDYDKMFQEKKKFKQQHELEIQQLENRLKKR